MIKSILPIKRLKHKQTDSSNARKNLFFMEPIPYLSFIIIGSNCKVNW